MKHAFAFACLSILLACGPVRADGRPLTFDEVAASALIKSPDAAKIDATLAERTADAFGVRVRENPTLSSQLGVPADRAEAKTEVSITLTQTLRPSDFGARTALARVIEETAGLDRVLALNEFLQSLRVAYARAWQGQEKAALLREGRARTQGILKRVAEGAGRGIYPQGDVELFKAELKMLEAESLAAAGDSAAARAALTGISGATFPDRALAPLPGLGSESRDDIEQLVRDSALPVRKRYDLLVALAEKQLEVARLDSYPAISPQIGYGRIDSGADQFIVGLSVPLPFFNRNQGERMRARGTLLAAERAKAYATSEGLVTEALLVFEAARRTSDQIRIYESGVLPARRRALDAYANQLEAGAGTVFQLWQAQRELNDSRLRTLDLRTSLAETVAQLNALLGRQRF